MADKSIKQQIVDKVKDSSNVLVTVSSNPSVDELSAALGITLLINKLNKHATAVFSGHVPPAIEFLEPEKTFEDTVDSLRDFIIALDKEKADHLRYKVVDDMVKIFITPYRTVISEKDLDFSQGDYNVEVVLAIGVKSEEDLDKALESHGRILHDATVAAISLGEATNLGGIEWVNKQASSYSEMLVELAESLKTDKNLLDEQIATAFLTGIVAATDRFSNDKTSSQVMTTAAQLMAAGANQQLIVSKLQESATVSAEPEQASSKELKENESTKVEREDTPAATPPEETVAADGSLAISHTPKGDVDEVAKAVAEQKSDEALDEAEAALSKQPVAAEETTPESTPATDEAPQATDPEQQLDADLAAVPATTPLRGPVDMSQWQTPADSAEPTLGGTLNATTEQAASDKQAQLDSDRNRTILTHGGGSYVTGEPTFQASINAANNPATTEPSVPDILAAGTAATPTAHVAAIQPPEPTQEAPTLAEIDAQHRAREAGAMADINAAFDAPAPVASPESPVDTPPAMGAESAAAPLPPLPAMPPMPDFSTLPPLPGAPSTPSSSPAPLPEETLGDLLPPLSPVGPIGSGPEPVTTAAADPAQFRIPGQ